MYMLPGSFSAGPQDVVCLTLRAVYDAPVMQQQS